MKRRDQKQSNPRPYKRRIHFSEREAWSYRIGNHGVLIRPPDNTETFRVPLTEITGMSWDELERGHWKGWWDGVGPQEVKGYIARHLRPDPNIPLPEFIFVHPHKVGATWHLRMDCPVLPQRKRRNPFDAARIGPGEAIRFIGAPATLRNLCSICCYRAETKETA